LRPWDSVSVTCIEHTFLCLQHALCRLGVSRFVEIEGLIVRDR
jgi:hypothetical protein